MKENFIYIQASHFKAKCLQLMDEVNDKHISIIVTKHGLPIAKLIPIDNKPKNGFKSYFGCMKHTLISMGDIDSPIDVKKK